MLDLDSVQADEMGTYPRPEYSEHEIIKPVLPTGQLVGDFVVVAGNSVQNMMRQMAGLFASGQPLGPQGMPKPGDRWYIADELLDEE